MSRNTTCLYFYLSLPAKVIISFRAGANGGRRGGGSILWRHGGEVMHQLDVWFHRGSEVPISCCWCCCCANRLTLAPFQPSHVTVNSAALYNCGQHRQRPPLNLRRDKEIEKVCFGSLFNSVFKSSLGKIVSLLCKTSFTVQGSFLLLYRVSYVAIVNTRHL